MSMTPWGPMHAGTHAKWKRSNGSAKLPELSSHRQPLSHSVLPRSTKARTPPPGIEGTELALMEMALSKITRVSGIGRVAHSSLVLA